jgi:hypothetical protein
MFPPTPSCKSPVDNTAGESASLPSGCTSDRHNSGDMTDARSPCHAVGPPPTSYQSPIERPARKSGRTSSCSRSAKGAWVWSIRPSSRSRLPPATSIYQRLDAAAAREISAVWAARAGCSLTSRKTREPSPQPSPMWGEGEERLKRLPGQWPEDRGLQEPRIERNRPVGECSVVVLGSE